MNLKEIHQNRERQDKEDREWQETCECAGPYQEHVIKIITYYQHWPIVRNLLNLLMPVNDLYVLMPLEVSKFVCESHFHKKKVVSHQIWFPAVSSLTL